MANDTSDRGSVQGGTTRGEFARTLAALFLFLVPVTYVAYLAAIVVHEVLGHGMAALALGGHFHRFVVHADGFGYAVIDGYEGHELVVLAAGVVVSIAAGMALLLVAARIQRPILGVALLLFAATLLEDALPYAFWGSLSAKAPSDFGRIVQLLGGPKTTAHVALSVGTGVGWAAMAILWMRPLVRRFGNLLGPLSTARAVAVYFCFAALDSGFWLLFDWDQVTPGLGRTPAYVGIGLECGVLAVLMARRRTAVETAVLGRMQWWRAIVGAWVVSAAVVAALLFASNASEARARGHVAYFSEEPVGSNTWKAIDGEPEWVAHPPGREDLLVHVTTELLDVGELPKASFLAEAGVFTRVIDSLTPVVGSQDARRAALAMRGALRITKHAYREENARSSRGGELVTTWWLAEVPIEEIVTVLPEDKREAARAALQERSPR